MICGDLGESVDREDLGAGSVEVTCKSVEVLGSVGTLSGCLLLGNRAMTLCTTFLSYARNGTIVMEHSRLPNLAERARLIAREIDRWRVELKRSLVFARNRVVETDFVRHER